MKLVFSAIVLLNLPWLAAAQPTTAPTTQATRPASSPATAPAPIPVPPPLPPVPVPAPPAAQLTGREIRDDGHFFAADTLARANERIEAIRRRFGKDVIIETYSAIPDDRKQRFAKLPKADFFDEWLKDRARARDANGVFILICRNPGHIQVAAGSKTRERIFTAENVRELNEVLLAPFRTHEYDLGLSRGLNQIEQRMEKNTGK